MKPRNLDDFKIFENFIRGLEKDSLSKDNPVIKMVEQLSKKLAYKFSRTAWIEDIKQQTLIKLSECNYTGEGSLEGYIRTVAKNVLFEMYRKEKEKMRGEMPSEVRVEVDFDDFLAEFDDYFQEVLSQRVRMLLSQTPRNLWWYIEAVIDTDEYISERQIAEDLEISRYKVSVARKELRSIWEEMEKNAE